MESWSKVKLHKITANEYTAVMIFTSGKFLLKRLKSYPFHVNIISQLNLDDNIASL